MKTSRTRTPKTPNPDPPAPPVSRRGFLNLLWTILGIGALAEFLWLVFSFLRPAQPSGHESQQSTVILAGALSDFGPGTVTAFQRGEFYLVRLADGGLLALSCKCTHLGCTVPWLEKEKKFLCPCHASAFDITGAVTGPPATRPLDLFQVTIENDTVRVDTGRKIKRAAFDPKQVVHPPKV